MTLDVNIAGPRRGELLETLPSSWYTDPAILEIERKEIFAATWQYVGTTGSIAEVGDYFTATLVDVPVIVSRAADGVHAMVNVCRHRFTPVAYDSGNTRRFSCPYHGWTYTLDGALCAAPRSAQIEDFDMAQFPLKALPVATWGPLVFVSLNPDVEPFDGWIAPVAGKLRDAGCDIDSLVMRKRTTFEVKANWKVFAENYLECYHCKVAHPSYTKSFDVSRSEGYAFTVDGNVFLSQTAPRERCVVDPSLMPYDSSGPIEVNQNDMLWPNVAPTIWPGQNNLLLLTWVPVSVGETLGYFDYFFGPDVEEKSAHELMEFLDEVGAEDKVLIESVQRGVTGNQIDTGRLVPDEGQVAHFHSLVRAAVI